MANLKGSTTEENLKAAFAGESQANRAIYTLPKRPTSKAITTLLPFSGQRRKARLVTPTVIWNFLKLSADPATGLPIGPTGRTCKRLLLARPMSIRICTREWRRQLAAKASKRSPTGSKPLAKAEKSHAGRFQKALDTMD